MNPTDYPRNRLAPSRMLWRVLIAGGLCGACSSPPPTEGTGTGSATGTGPSDDTTPGEYLCDPGQIRCASPVSLEVCAPTGLEWITMACETNQTCEPCNSDTCSEDRCIGPCELGVERPSSAGCSFIANRQLHLNEDSPDGLVVTNPNESLRATVQLYHTPLNENEEQEVGPPRVLEPEQSTLFELDADFLPGSSSVLRTGGNYRVQSDAPVVAYQHSPLVNDRGNDSSMLLPEATLRQDYVVFSYAPHEEEPHGEGEPSYFEIVALENFTEVQWTPPVDTAGNQINIDSVLAGETSDTLDLNRFDTARIAASANFQANADLRDVSGTVIRSNKPIWVVGASRCSRVPVRDEPARGHCDPLQELLIPLDYWGERYVAAHSPTRDDERHWWRIYSGDSNVRVTALGNAGCSGPVITADNCTPPNTYDDGACILEQRGSWIPVDVPSECSFFLDSEETGAFMPVQYLQSSRDPEEPAQESTTRGDPAMYQMVPVEQFLTTYVFSTGVGFDEHYVQVIRQANGPAVYLDGLDVTGFEPVGEEYEVADVQLGEEGPHVIDSGATFGIVQFGYTSGTADSSCSDGDACPASYAYPGGMRSEQINIP